MSYLLVTGVVMLLILNGCGGGGDDTKIEPGPSSSVFERQNYYAETYTEAAINFASAREEGEALIAAALGEDWQEKTWSPEAVIALLGEEDAKALLNKLNDINTKKIAPALEIMASQGDQMLAAEAEIDGLLNLAPNQSGSQKHGVLRPFVIDDFLIAAAILAPLFAVGAAVSQTVDKETTGNTIEDIGNTLDTWAATAWEGTKAFVASAGENAAWFLGGVWAKAKDLKNLALGIDVASTGKTAYDTGVNILGIKDCTKAGQQSGELQLGAILAAARAAEPEAVYVGKSDSTGTFYNIPEGEWAFIVFKDGLARGTICVDLKDDTTQSTVEMEPIENVHDTVLDDDEDGYTEAQGDCDDADSAIHPTAVEVCDDAVDNDCDGAVDCDDGDCESDTVCQSSSSAASSSSHSSSVSSISSSSSVGADAVSINVSIPGYSRSFTPQFTGFTFGNVNDGPAIYPSILSLTGTLENYNPMAMDIFLIMISESLPGPGTYLIDETSFHEGGSATINFGTPLILGQAGFDWPVLFGSISGSITFEYYGVNIGDRLKGSFSVTVEGEQDFCADATCDKINENIITGTISGSFDGTLKSPSAYLGIEPPLKLENQAIREPAVTE